ncbi:hypothetical protein AVEN_86392-1, partial [Araneus ventricosus]
FPDQEPPRWFFKDFYSSFILVFCMLCGDWKQPMVNTVLFTSYSSDLLMLIFVLIGNFVIINLFLGIVFYTFFYKSLPRNLSSEDKLQSAIQVILNRQVNLSETVGGSSVETALAGPMKAEEVWRKKTTALHVNFVTNILKS